MQFQANGHHFHDIGSPGCPYIDCKNCDIEYLDFDARGQPHCEKEPAPVVAQPSTLSLFRRRIAALAADAQYRVRQTWLAVRFGTITETVKSVDGGVASEIEYRGRNGVIVGYWAYGSFDPSFPYRG